MRAKVTKGVKAPTTVVVALAFVAVVLYSLWGGIVLRSQAQAQTPAKGIATTGR